ncbi:hypothetical protein ACFU6I_35525 [Streptomyces sp. NPDC057486]|uniref:hypothetical protein n=1 Tax=Streptomyces sp. NPDC057486 TaxID=3346145 RepID=UPI0036C052BA
MVATAAAGDGEYGNLVGRACAKAGDHGSVSVEEAHVVGVELEFAEVMCLGAKLLSPFMVTHAERGEAVLDDAYRAGSPISNTPGAPPPTLGSAR